MDTQPPFPVHPVPYRLITRPAFEVVGRQTWIGGPDNAAFERFWAACRADGLFDVFATLTGFRPGPQTGGATLGISRVEADPAQRAFHFMVAVEVPPGAAVPADGPGALIRYTVPAATWAVFEAHGPAPDAIVGAEMFAFFGWLPDSGYVHAPAPELEVYPPEREDYAEFWLPVTEG